MIRSALLLALLRGASSQCQNGGLHFDSPDWSSEKGAVRFHGHPFHIRGTAWSGMETSDPIGNLLDIGDSGDVLAGVYAGTTLLTDAISDRLKQITTAGFNAVRLPMAADVCLKLDELVDDAEEWTYGDVFQAILDEAATIGLVVVADMHTMVAGEEGGTWLPQATWQAAWIAFMEAYGGHVALMGIDLLNEPSLDGDVNWDNGDEDNDWFAVASALIEDITDGIAEFKGLFFVQGVTNDAAVSTSNLANHYEYFPGENLLGAKSSPILSDRVVYSPHVWGPTIDATMSYFAADDFQDDLADVYDEHFGWIENATDRAVVIGAWGGLASGDDEKYQAALAEYLAANCLGDNFYWVMNAGDEEVGGWLTSTGAQDTDKLTFTIEAQPYPSHFAGFITCEHYCLLVGDYSSSACAPAPTPAPTLSPNTVPTSKPTPKPTTSTPSSGNGDNENDGTVTKTAFTVTTPGTDKHSHFGGSHVGFSRTLIESKDSEAMELTVASISELDADGEIIGADADNFVDMYGVAGNFADDVDYPLHQLDTSSLVFTMTEPQSVTYQGLAAKKVVYKADILDKQANLRLESYVFQTSGTITTNGDEKEPVTNGTLKVNLELSDWPFCRTGGMGYNRCLKVPDDITHDSTEVPYTVLQPVCEQDGSDVVATMDFHCIGDSRCDNLKKVWFYFGASNKVPDNIHQMDVNGSNFQDDGVYRLNITTAIVSQFFVGQTTLTPGMQYKFYSVYGFLDDEAPQYDTQDPDYNYAQIWQCPGTIIGYNYQVGEYLDVTLRVAGKQTPTLIACSGRRRQRRLSTTTNAASTTSLSCTTRGDMYSFGTNARLTLSGYADTDGATAALPKATEMAAAGGGVTGGDFTLRFKRFASSIAYDPILDYEAASDDDTSGLQVGNLSKDNSIILVACLCAAGGLLLCCGGGFAYRRRKAKMAAAAAAAGGAGGAAAAAAAKPKDGQQLAVETAHPSQNNSPMHQRRDSGRP